MLDTVVTDAVDTAEDEAGTEVKVSELGEAMVVMSA